MMEIELDEIKAVVNRLFDHAIKERGVKSISIEQPFYWKVMAPELYDMDIDKSNVELTVGSLADDWEFVSSLKDRSADPTAYQFTELAPLLEYIGYELGKELAGKGG